MQRIIFKSNPENFRKEYLGLKKNTIRHFDGTKDDIREVILNDWIDNEKTMIEIEIQNKETNELFVRTVTDVTYYEGWYIISWN